MLVLKFFRLGNESHYKDVCRYNMQTPKLVLELTYYKLSMKIQQKDGSQKEQFVFDVCYIWTYVYTIDIDILL